MPKITTANPDDLQFPARVHCLESLEEHIRRTARLSRAMWNAVEGAQIEDERDKTALEALASEVADHASAVMFLFYREADAARAKGIPPNA